jgi:hypothetical protein
MDRLREAGWEEEIRINETCRGLLFDRRVRRACEQDLTEKGVSLRYYLLAAIPTNLRRLAQRG